MNLTSLQNPQLKLARRTRDGKEKNLIFVEGARLVDECLRSKLTLKAAFVATTEVRHLSDTVTGQGLIVLAIRPGASLKSIFDRFGQVPLLVTLDQVQDPGNAGTIVRTAEAAGATAVIGTPGTAEPFSPKALRSSMGSSFRLPIVSGVSIADLSGDCREHGIQIVGTAAEGKIPYTDCDWTKPTMVIFGNEAVGLSSEALSECTHVVRIPLTEPVESLNVASAAAAVLFEAARQRRGV